MSLATSFYTSAHTLVKFLNYQSQYLGWLSLAILVIFTWLPNSYYEMVSLPWIAIWQLGFLLSGWWSIWMLRHYPFRPLGYNFDRVVGIGAIALILSTVFSSCLQLSVWYVNFSFCYALLFYVLRNWLEDRHLSIYKLWVGFSVVGIVTGLINLGKTLYDAASGLSFWRNAFPLGHPNFISGYLLLVFPLTVTLSLSLRGWRRIITLAASMILLVDLYVTQSRGGLLGLFVLTLVFLGFWIAKSARKRKKRVIIASAIALITIISLVLSSHRAQQIIKLSFSSHQLPSLQLNIDGESEDRLFMAQAAFNMFTSHPWLGVGIGNMSRVYNLYRPIEVGAGASHVQQLHNTPLQILGELGIAGLSVYILLIATILRLWLRLDRHLKDRKNRLLLYGVGGSLLAYAVSSLTDYQLENIGISSAIVLLLVLLIGLADREQLAQPLEFSRLDRRYLSLGVIAFIISELCLWLPVDRAMFLATEAYQNLTRSNLTQSYEKLITAANLVPWDPTYNQLAGFQLLQAQSVIKDSSLTENLRQSALDRLKGALGASPYDVWFNHNVGILYAGIEPQQAEIYFSRAIQLQPRDVIYYDYCLLGQAYLQQGKTEKAIHAFALQELILPEFLTFRMWLEPSLANIRNAVVNESVSLWEKLLEQIPQTDVNYNSAYENLAILKWWNKLPQKDLDLKRLRPIAQVLIVAQKSPQQALDILDRELKKSPKHLSLLLFRAWLQPEKYLPAYLENNKNSDRELIKQSIEKKSDLRNWLISIDAQLSESDRVMDIFVYRNVFVSLGNSILTPNNIHPNYLVAQLGLFPSWFPRSFPTLEQLVDRAKVENLNLLHPTRNKFKLAPSLPSDRAKK
jgi:O-antigen ligase